MLRKRIRSFFRSTTDPHRSAALSEECAGLQTFSALAFFAAGNADKRRQTCPHCPGRVFRTGGLRGESKEYITSIEEGGTVNISEEVIAVIAAATMLDVGRLPDAQNSEAFRRPIKRPQGLCG